MIGASAGDIIATVFEQSPFKTTTFPLFSKSFRLTDDTVLRVAIADAILTVSANTDLTVNTIPFFKPHRSYPRG